MFVRFTKFSFAEEAGYFYCLILIVILMAILTFVDDLVVFYISFMSSAFIQFDKPFYFAGDTIEGHVYLYLSEPVNARDVSVKFKGWEVVRWME